MGARHNSPHTGGPLPGERLVARKTFRIGVQQLSYTLEPISEGSKRVRRQYYLAIKNRTYYSKHPIPHATAGRYRKVLS